MKRDEPLAFPLVELLLFQHADFVFGGVHAPILDVDVELGEVEVGSDGMSAQDAKAFVVAVGNAMSGKPVSDEAFAIGPDESAGPGSDGFVEFDVGVEIASVEEDFVEAGVAKNALEGL